MTGRRFVTLTTTGASLVLAGCGNDDSPTETTEGEPEAELGHPYQRRQQPKNRDNQPLRKSRKQR
ncbi:hypothetical protein ACFQL7_23075 [Halocatena marina]|uniref:Uncharacterized protein n=2 Tax=Halocatena marina TaxID=2934937 RepID=A0ABD5YU16_9EURY